MIVLALWEFRVSVFRLDLEGMGAEVITLGLEQVGREILRAVSVIEAQGRTESWCGNAPFGALSYNVSPTFLSVMNGFVEEVIKQQVLEIRVLPISACNVLEEDGANDAASSPHECDRGLVQFPAVFFGSLHDHEYG